MQPVYSVTAATCARAAKCKTFPRVFSDFCVADNVAMKSEFSVVGGRFFLSRLIQSHQHRQQPAGSILSTTVVPHPPTHTHTPTQSITHIIAAEAKGSAVTQKGETNYQPLDPLVCMSKSKMLNPEFPPSEREIVNVV